MRTLRLPLTALVVAALTAACSPGTPAAPTGSLQSDAGLTRVLSQDLQVPADARCDDYRKTYQPLPVADRTAGLDDPTLQRIRARGTLRVGVSEDSPPMSYRAADGSFKGMDVDMARLVAAAVFGDDSPDRIEFVTITAEERFDALKSGKADIVARAVTMTCQRWQVSSMSSEFLTGYQALLLRGAPDQPGHIREHILPRDLPSSVCAVKGTTSAGRLTQYQGVEVVLADNHSDCMSLFARDRVQGVWGDDVIVAGNAVAQGLEQDTHIVRDIDVRFSEPYALALPQDSVVFTAFVNRVLCDAKADGRWQAAYTSNLAPNPLIGDRGVPPVFWGGPPTQGADPDLRTPTDTC